MDEQHLTVEELAHREQVSIATIYGWNHHKRGPRFMRIGRGGRGAGVRYRLADVIAWEESRLVT